VAGRIAAAEFANFVVAPLGARRLVHKQNFLKIPNQVPKGTTTKL
jgi:hypothetical protein